MKITQYLLPFVLSVITVVGCDRRKQIEIVNYESYDLHEHPEVIDYGLVQYDSVTFSDGSYAVTRVAYAPMNSLTEFKGADGSLLGTVSSASETCSQSLIYGYDGSGRLKYLLYYEALLLKEKDHPFEIVGEDSYLLFRQAIDDVDFGYPDLKRHLVAEVIYGADGLAHEVVEQPTGKTIKAPEGYCLEASAVPCNSFWESDLRGGRISLKVDMLPVTKTASDYTISHFEDFELVSVDHYKNGILHSSDSYIEP